MIKFIGDLSKADAEVLKAAAEKYSSILEFGCGASTQIFAKYRQQGAEVVSIDTSIEWIDKTVDNLRILGIDPNSIELCDFNSFIPLLVTDAWKNVKYNFIFNDGVDALRRPFAIQIWPFLSVGGTLAFHDTRRPHDFRNVLEVLAQFQNEIGRVEFNIAGSNITLIEKTLPKPYDNWQITEKKEPWMLGYGPIPEYYKEIMKESI
jgi:predicted O-methyltransferase YrrM